MSNLYIMCGLAFSGKSTLVRKIAEQTGSKRIAFDELVVEQMQRPTPEENVMEFTPNSDLNEFIQKLK